MKRLFALLLCGVLMVPPGLAAPAADWPQWAEEALSWGCLLYTSDAADD